MTKVLIADAIKPSLVMSSEVFKDKIPGSTVVVATSGAAALQLAAEINPDICLIDFDLPDVDGPALILELRKVFSGPILMTAYPDENVEKSVMSDLACYNDASAWIRKPVRFEALAAQIDQFLVERRRTGRRFPTDLPMKLTAKSAGRGKRAPKGVGRVLNLSLGGACIVLDDEVEVKSKQELTLAIHLLSPKMQEKHKSTVAKSLAAKSKVKSKTKVKLAPMKVDPKSPEATVRATVAWIDKRGQMGVKFEKLNDAQQNELERFLKVEAQQYLRTPA